MKFFVQDENGYVYFSREALTYELVHQFIFANGEWVDEDLAEVKVGQVSEFVETFMSTVGAEGIRISEKDVRGIFACGCDQEFRRDPKT